MKTEQEIKKRYESLMRFYDILVNNDGELDPFKLDDIIHNVQERIAVLKWVLNLQ